MSESEITRRTVPSWLVGLLAATGAVIAIGFVSIGFFVSLGGLVIAGVVRISVAPSRSARPDFLSADAPGRGQPRPEKEHVHERRFSTEPSETPARKSSSADRGAELGLPRNVSGGLLQTRC